MKHYKVYCDRRKILICAPCTLKEALEFYRVYRIIRRGFRDRLKLIYIP